MPKKNIELLKRLRTRFLRMRHRKHFNMSSWIEKNECGTAACIAGHALLLEGYRVVPKRCELGKPDCGCVKGEFTFATPHGRRVDPSATAQRLLGLSSSVANQLFSDFSLKTPKQAAKRIEALIKDSEPAR